MAESVQESQELDQESQESAVQQSKESLREALAAMLEDEFKRVVATESISMAELVKDVAQSIHYTERHIYNCRREFRAAASLLNTTARCSNVQGSPWGP